MFIFSDQSQQTQTHSHSKRIWCWQKTNKPSICFSHLFGLLFYLCWGCWLNLRALGYPSLYNQSALFDSQSHSYSGHVVKIFEVLRSPLWATTHIRLLYVSVQDNFKVTLKKYFSAVNELWCIGSRDKTIIIMTTHSIRNRNSIA